MSAPNPSLRKATTMRYAVALYMSSVLGSGVLVLPGLAAQIAGPASLVAWVALSIISYPLGYTIASLSARRPESGGVYSFARESLGPGAASAVGWLFILWYVTGAPVVTVIAASYLAYAFPLTRTEIFLIAGLLTLGAFLVNYRGIVVSSRVQLAVIVAIVGLLITAVVASFAVMLSNALGIYGAVGTAILAVIIIFGTMNAYTTGISRVIYATAKDRGLPRLLDRINTKTQVPDRSLMLLLGLSWITLLLFYVFNVDLETELLIPSGAAILVYIIGSSSGIKLLKVKSAKKLFPWISLAISIIMLFFVGLPILIALLFALLGFVYRRRSSQLAPVTLELGGKGPVQS